MKKWMAFLMTAALLLTITACGKKEEPSAGMANPWQDAADLKAAEELAGFSMTAPDTLDGYEKKEIRVCTTEGAKIFEITFRNVNDESVCIRKGEGSEDISGDYNQYDGGGEMEIGGNTVSVRSNGSAVRVATWQSGGFTYAVNFSAGMSADSAAQIIEAVQ